MRLTAATLMLGCLAAPVMAAADNEQPSSKPKKEKRICREVTPTGSRLGKRVCHTEAEWAEIDRTNGENAGREVDRIAAMGRSEGSGFNPN